MRRELTELLVAAGVEAGIAGDWTRISIVNGAGGMLGEEHGPEDGSSRGFHLLLADGRGVPSHFCKCRRVGDASLGHEARVLAAIASDPELRPGAPTAGAADSARLSVLVTRYLPGELYAHLVAREAGTAWLHSVEAITALAERLCAHVARALPELSAEDVVPLEATAAEALARLGALGLSAEDLATLSAALRAGGSVPARLQHGDLWPANVLRRRAHWCLLDFEQFGLVRVPLHDYCHLLCTSIELRAGAGVMPGAGSSTEWLVSHAGREARALLRRAAERHALSPAQAEGACAFYVVEMAARLHRQAPHGLAWVRPLDEARALAAALRDGLSPLA